MSIPGTCLQKIREPSEAQSRSGTPFPALALSCFAFPGEQSCWWRQDSCLGDIAFESSGFLRAVPVFSVDCSGGLSKVGDEVADLSIGAEWLVGCGSGVGGVWRGGIWDTCCDECDE